MLRDSVKSISHTKKFIWDETKGVHTTYHSFNYTTLENIRSISFVSDKTVDANVYGKLETNISFLKLYSRMNS